MISHDEAWYLEHRVAFDPLAPADEFLETPSGAPSSWSRRSFLKLAGFGVGATLLAGCSRAPTSILRPALDAAEDIVPGVGVDVATTCGGCNAGCGLLVRVRDGRPIKAEGFRPKTSDGAAHPISGGGVCAIGQALLLGLYDSKRLTAPQEGATPRNFAAADGAIRAALAAAARDGLSVRLLTPTITGPSTTAAIGRFLAAHPTARHVVHDSDPRAKAMLAEERAFGTKRLPWVRLDRAGVVFSLGADPLGLSISPVEAALAWAKGRDPDAADRSYWIQAEGRLSLTGAKADRRILADAAERKRLLVDVVRMVAKSLEVSLPTALVAPLTPWRADVAADIAARLVAAKGRALVLADAEDLELQLAVAFLNHALGAYGGPLDLGRADRRRQGSEGGLAALVDELESGQVGVVLIHGLDPVHESALGERFGRALAKARLVAATSTHRDATAQAAHWIVPDRHPFEAFDDHEPVEGIYSLSQPTVRPNPGTRSLRESLLAWSGETTDDGAFRRTVWSRLLGLAAGTEAFANAWARIAEDGHFERAASAPGVLAFSPKAFDGIVYASAATTAAGDFEIEAHPSHALLDGRHAYNAWLQELPDPITKICWGNAVSMAPATAQALGIEDGDEVLVSAGEGGGSVRLPVVIQPGQHERVLSVPFGYGRMGTDRFSGIGPQWLEGKATVKKGERIGASVAALGLDGAQRIKSGIVVRRTGGRETLARTQSHHFLSVPKHLAPEGGEVRNVVRRLGAAEYAAGAAAMEHHHGGDLWADDHRSSGPKWGLEVDLERCTGCSACVLSCQVENNVPVVGKDETARAREMHWIRVDRYYLGEGEDLEVAHQPMMCQHCKNAPCESVCPVLATVHGKDGLNHQVYNRCVGTRYCANNCPYKVRRFNWFDYAHADALENLALNPDVTVRSRGVMEKCTFCLQRIQAAKHAARAAGSAIPDGAIEPACVQTCPTRALSFGDRADPKSAVSKLAAGRRHYEVLGEINVRPSVGYLAIVRADDEKKG